MSDHHDSQEIIQLQQVNEELSASLERCRFILADCRSKLAANANGREAANDDSASDADERRPEKSS